MPHSIVKDKEGNELPSVTQVIGILGKPELYRWYGNLGWEEAERQKREAGEWGTELHSSITEWLKKGVFNSSLRCNSMLNNFVSWVKQSRFKAIEIEPIEPLISKLYGYQGTFDCVGELDNELIVCDWKTSSRIYPENGLQLAAYANLWNEIHPKEKIRNGLIVRIDKKTAKVQVKGFYNFPMYFEVFKSLLPVYDFVKKRGVWRD